jgi:hypothetical protein
MRNIFFSFQETSVSGIPKEQIAYQILAAKSRYRPPGSMSVLEELYCAFVFFGFIPSAERAQVPALAGLRIKLSRIEPVQARLEFANHGNSPATWTVKLRRSRLVSRSQVFSQRETQDKRYSS